MINQSAGEVRADFRTWAPTATTARVVYKRTGVRVYRAFGMWNVSVFVMGTCVVKMAVRAVRGI